MGWAVLLSPDAVSRLSIFSGFDDGQTGYLCCLDEFAGVLLEARLRARVFCAEAVGWGLGADFSVLALLALYISITDKTCGILDFYA